MMFTEVVHRFAPQFMMPLFETMVILLEYFQQTMTDMTQFVFQTFVFPPIAFIYDTSSSLIKEGLKLVDVIRSYLENLLPGFITYVEGNSKSLINKSTNIINNNSNDKIEKSHDSQPSTGSNEEFGCQSSFDGSSNTSITESINENNTTTNNIDNNNAGIDEKDISETNNNNIDDIEGEDKNFRQKLIDQVGCIQNGISGTTTELKEKVGDAWNKINELQLSDLKNLKFEKVKELTPKRLKSISENTCQTFGYYKREYVEYYTELFMDMVKNPMKVVEKAKEYANTKYELLMEYKESFGEWIEYGKEQVILLFDKLKEIYGEIREGKFDHKQLLWDICDWMQNGLTRLCRYCGSDSIFTKVLDRLHVLPGLLKIKNHLKGPTIVHQKQY